MSEDDDCLQLGWKRVERVPSWFPAAVTAVIGGIFEDIFIGYSGSTVPSSRIFWKLEIGIEHAQP